MGCMWLSCMVGGWAEEGGLPSCNTRPAIPSRASGGRCIFNGALPAISAILWPPYLPVLTLLPTASPSTYLAGVGCHGLAAGWRYEHALPPCAWRNDRAAGVAMSWRLRAAAYAKWVAGDKRSTWKGAGGGHHRALPAASCVSLYHMRVDAQLLAYPLYTFSSSWVTTRVLFDGGRLSPGGADGEATFCPRWNASGFTMPQRHWLATTLCLEPVCYSLSYLSLLYRPDGFSANNRGILL